MSPSVLNRIGSVCFGLAVILLVVAWDCYRDHAALIEAVNDFKEWPEMEARLKEMIGPEELQPGMPKATKYALVLALLAGVGGVVCMVVAVLKDPGGIYTEES